MNDTPQDHDQDRPEGPEQDTPDQGEPSPGSNPNGPLGWVKLHRKFTEWEWYNDHNATRLFIHLLLKANSKPKKWQGIIIQPGEVVTGLFKLRDETGLSLQQVRTALDKLKSTNEITNKTTSKYSLIKLNKWTEYQANNKENNKRVTNEQQTDNNKQEGKEIKEVFKKEIYKEKKSEKEKKPKHRHGEFQNVLLTEAEEGKLREKYGPEGAAARIKELDEGIERKGYSYRSHYLAILKWAENERKQAEKEKPFSIYDLPVNG